MAFKIAQAVALAALLAFSPIARAADPGCNSPGEHTCAILFVSTNFDFSSSPDGPGPDGDSFAGVVNGNCDTIVTSGGMEPQSPGFREISRQPLASRFMPRPVS
ncbi:hypothetical protein TGAMA5MH_09100 [Trichoderma gamsii]|uniref:Uncharacterized protein n=1 Tax=Trichoderma gamsii TaxID=398673 RepID=A0A2K0T025_9HYPO|nr:hypothetical protein TGAMA5MH_09100 [Trichoderma gamsii]